eukprot:TRINITY_DN5316_c0_g1_i1.p1 TRINITY_DN5316_c0_g1~~TRINITY_DN5316_c0_g1_i1.p1  ORF type:complete len:329 (-),score=76.72 TRINITY_DN5316_c0_g1_i1:63-998(-)
MKYDVYFVVLAVLSRAFGQPNICTQSKIGEVCPVNATCCAAQYSETGLGCCPFSNATCCPNAQTCCPSGFQCQDNGQYLTTCVSTSDSNNTVVGTSVCKRGPAIPASTTKPNVIVLGDSVSIGYTPHVAANLSERYLVQHTPYDDSDGGAEETAYGIQCLDYFLSTPQNVEFNASLVVFNWGMHNVFDGTVPGQNGDPGVYNAQLQVIVERLLLYCKDTGAKLLWVTTTPVPFNVTANDNAVAHNKFAALLMASFGIPTVDLYQAVIDYCGPVPDYNCKCDISLCNNVHYTEKGWAYLSSFVAPAIASILG